MGHSPSNDDLIFLQRVEACRIAAADFDHRAHLRLAYIYLADDTADSAYTKMREALSRLLEYLGADPSIYHDTLTRAWLLAVRHFMEKTRTCTSAEDFIAQNPQMLDASIMMTHYSPEQLHCDAARRQFLEPDLQPIPRYDN